MNRKIKIILTILIIVLLIIASIIGINVNLSNKSNEKYLYNMQRKKGQKQSGSL